MMIRMVTKFFAVLVVLGHGIAFGVDDPAEEAFNRIYRTGEWGRDEDGNGTSGEGSRVDIVWPYMQLLIDFLEKKKIKSVVDVGCGDWQFSQYIDWSGIEYIGYDIVKSVIEKNIREYSKPNITFIHGNGVVADLPHADLLVCKDVLQHLSIQTINKLLAQVDKFKYCIITNDLDSGSKIQNSRIADGGLRPLDLNKPPFNLTAKKLFDYQSESTHKQVFLIVNRKLIFQEMYGSNE